MKFFTLILFVVFASQSAVSSVLVQEKHSDSPPAKSTSPEEKVTVTTKYDPEKDETTVAFDLLELTSKQAKRVLLSVSASFSGHKLKTQPEDVIMILSVVSGRRTYSGSIAMHVLADGDKLPDVLMLNLDKRTIDDDFLETMGTRMRFDEFRNISRAKEVFLQLEGLKLELHASDLSLFGKMDLLLEAAPNGQAALPWNRTLKL